MIEGVICGLGNPFSSVRSTGNTFNSVRSTANTFGGVTHVRMSRAVSIEGSVTIRFAVGGCGKSARVQQFVGVLLQMLTVQHGEELKHGPLPPYHLQLGRNTENKHGTLPPYHLQLGRNTENI